MLEQPRGRGRCTGSNVDPDRIGTGLGRRLFGHVVADLAELHDAIVVWHFVGNDRVTRFYEAAGFPLDGARRHSDFGPEEVRRPSVR